MANNGTKPSLGSTLTTVAGWVSQGLGYDTFQHTNGQSGSDGYSASIGSLSSGDLCKIPPKSPKLPPRHLGDFP